MTEPKKRTTAKIRATLVNMLGNKDIDKVTVTDLCTSAGINRATFYYHYDSVRDVFHEVERLTEEEFNEFLNQTALNDDGVPDKNFYTTFFEFIARNANICKMILNSPHKTDDSFMARAMEAGCNKAMNVIKNLLPSCPVSKIKYYYLFVSHGFLGLMTYWLNTGMKETPEEIALIGEKVSNSGAKFLES
ncbi:MAG: TetR/AcrR family transcriptional regulator [Clostridiales bacterium]|nr:TetR/AcrR family transcriptional regulator [Clostridiales bacterium]